MDFSFSYPKKIIVWSSRPPTKLLHKFGVGTFCEYSFTLINCPLRTMIQDLLMNRQTAARPWHSWLCGPFVTTSWPEHGKHSRLTPLTGWNVTCAWKECTRSTGHVWTGTLCLCVSVYVWRSAQEKMEIKRAPSSVCECVCVCVHV